MYEREFQKDWTELSFEGRHDFFSFLDELEMNTNWAVASAAMQLYALDTSSAPVGDLISTPEQWQRACKSRGIALRFQDSVTGNTFEGIFNKLTAPLSANERAGAKCSLTNKFLDEYQDCYGRLITKGINVNGEKVKVLKRGGQVMAMHSSKYNTISQKAIFTTAHTAMSEKFKNSKLIHASFNPDVTHAAYALCDGNGEFMKTYAKTWTEAGMPQAMLAKTNPIIDFATSDTGRYTISIRPLLKIGKNTYPIGSELKMKHNGLADVMHIGSNVDKCYAEMQEALTTIEEMQKLKLIHPYAVFVRACHESGLYKFAKNLCRETLDIVKSTYEEDEEISAFSMYREICDIQDREAFRDLAPNTALQCLESFSRLLQLKWDEMDRSGPVEFN